MAVLSDADRNDTARKLMQKAFGELNQTANLDTAEIRTLINDIDTWADANAVPFNTSITLAIRNKATASMKALALAWVCLKRAGVI